MGGNHFPPPRNHLPPYAQLDLIHGRSIPRAVSLNLLAYGRGQTDTAGACFDSDGKTEEFPSIRSYGFIVSVPRRGSLLHRLNSRPTCLHNLGEISNVFLLESFLAGLGELRVQDRFNPLKVQPKRAWFLARGRETARQQFAQPLTGLVQLGFGIPNRAAQNPRDLIVLISLNVVQN
jgi:hypothetical protein